MLLRIFDRDPGNSSLLVPFHGLLKLVLSTRPSLVLESWSVLRGAYGYGLNVCDLEHALEASTEQPLDVGSCLQWFEEGEYFEQATLVCRTEDLEVGVFDASYLFLDSNDVGLVERVRHAYADARQVET